MADWQVGNIQVKRIFIVQTFFDAVSYFFTEIEPEFKASLQVLVPGILAPQNLVVKEISGQKVKAKELMQYFKSYIEIYQGDELPEPKSMLVVSY